MGLGDDLLIILGSYHEGYRLMRRRMRGDTRPVRPHHIPDASEAVLRVTLTRLKKRGLVRNERGVWHLTKKGTAYLASRMPWLRRFPGKDKKAKEQKNMIVAFDIPEQKRRERDWLRLALVDLGFAMLQKSVWLGPAPLPKEFIVSLKNLKVLEHMKFFKAEEQDIV